MNKLLKGYTLVELIISVGIISLIMAVVFFNYRSFNDNLALSAAQQEISLAIRQAQIYGLSVKESQKSSNSFDSGYGIYFNKNDNTSYYLFIDKNILNNAKYDGSSNCSTSAECVEKGNLRNGIKITSICGTTFAGVNSCTYSTFHTTFKRPNIDANIGFDSIVGTYKTGQVVLTSPLGKTANIIIQSTGQISVQ